MSTFRNIAIIKKTRLADQFIQLQCLQGDGNQAIQLSWLNGEILSLDVNFIYNGGKSDFIFGAWVNTSGNTGFSFDFYQQGRLIRSNGAIKYISNNRLVIGNLVNLKFENGAFSIDGRVLTGTVDLIVQSNELINFCIFGLFVGNKKLSFSNSKFYNFAYKTTNGEYNLVPALCKQGKYYIDGNTEQEVLATYDKPGMYDKNSGKFYTNIGTGQFTYELKS